MSIALFLLIGPAGTAFAAPRAPQGPLGPVFCPRQSPEEPGKPLLPGCMTAEPRDPAPATPFFSAPEESGVSQARVRVKSASNIFGLPGSSLFDGTANARPEAGTWGAEDFGDPRSFTRAEYLYRQSQAERGPAARRRERAYRVESPVAARSAPPLSAPEHAAHDPLLRREPMTGAPAARLAPARSSVPADPRATRKAAPPSRPGAYPPCERLPGLSGACVAVDRRLLADGTPRDVKLLIEIPGIHSHDATIVYRGYQIGRFTDEFVALVTDCSYCPATRRHLAAIEKEFNVRIADVTLSGLSGAGNSKAGLNVTARELSPLRIVKRVILSDVVHNLDQTAFQPLIDDPAVDFQGYINFYRQPLDGVTLETQEAHFPPWIRCAPNYVAGRGCNGEARNRRGYQ